MGSKLEINNDGNLANVGKSVKVKKQIINHWAENSNAQRNRKNPSVFTVPSSLTDEDFVGHQVLLTQVSESVKNNKKVALYGLGGVGTSRLAAEVATKLHQNTFDCVFWVDATSITSFMRGMESIAERLGLDLKADASSHANAAKVWMEAHANGSWLLILDAAGPEAVSDSHELSVDSNENNFLQRLPQRSTIPLRTILVTTCQKDIALAWCRQSQSFEVPFLEPKEAELLLRNMSGDQESKEQDVISLAEELDRNPSALLSAAALIRMHSEAGETISSFLTTCRKRKDKAITLFNGKHPSTHALYKTTRSLTVTWCKAIEAIQNESQRACDMLCLAACLDGNEISLDLFCNAFGWKENSSELRAEISTLLNYRLISRDKTNGFYRMPRLVRLTIRDWMKSQTPTSDTPTVLLGWHLRALESLMRAYDKMESHPGHSRIRAQLRRRALLPHAAMFQQFCKIEGECKIRLQEDQFRAIVVFSELFSSEGRYKTAEHMLGFARESPVADSHWRKIAMLKLAEALRNQTFVDGDTKRLKKAIYIASEVQKIENGNESIDLWGTFAMLFADKGKFEQAAAYQGRIVAELTQEFGENDLGTIAARLELSKIRYREGRLKDALEQQKHIEHILQTEPLSADPDITSRLLQVRAALVRTYYSLRDLQTAVKVAAQVVDGRAELFGDLDMKTIGSEKDLAQCLVELNRKDEAIKTLESVERKLRHKFGSNHREVCDCVIRLTDIRNEMSIPEADAVLIA